MRKKLSHECQLRQIWSYAVGFHMTNKEAKRGFGDAKIHTDQQSTNESPRSKQRSMVWVRLGRSQHCAQDGAASQRLKDRKCRSLCETYARKRNSQVAIPRPAVSIFSKPIHFP